MINLSRNKIIRDSRRRVYLVFMFSADEPLAIAMAAIMALVMYSSCSMLWLLHSRPQPDTKKAPKGLVITLWLAASLVA